MVFKQVILIKGLSYFGSGPILQLLVSIPVSGAHDSKVELR